MTLTANRKIWLALGALALAQTAVLAGMVIDRVRLLRTGREITLPVVPVDPRDFFRGEFVRLGYDVGRVPLQLLAGPAPAANAPFYVTLEKSGDGSWRPARISRDLPDSLPSDRIVLKARTRGAWPEHPSPTQTLWVRYGIESYFVPQGQGPELEKLAREKKLAAILAVDSAGNAAIKALLVEGRDKLQDPLF
jgi:uncharacterized membrane-anchored protein